MRLAAVLLAMAIAAPTLAQYPNATRSTSQRIGGFRYAEYDTPGGRVSASYNRVGRFEYGYYSDGTRSTSRQVGSFLYTDYDQPRSNYRVYQRPSGPGYRRYER